jgi:hypothetical protein
MLNPGQESAVRHAVASLFIGHDHTGHISKTLQQPSKETFGCFGIPSWLNENVEHDTILVHGTPKTVLHALDSQEDLIKVPTCHRAADDGGAGGRRSSARTSCTSDERSHMRR